MITKLTIKSPEWLERIHNKRAEFEFSPGVNIICGPNGSGKSTLVNCIIPRRGHASNPKEVEILFEGSQRVQAYRSEEDGVSAAHKGFFDEDLNMGFQLSMMRVSRGQAQATYLGRFIKDMDPKKAEGTLVWDEPDSALDHPGCAMLARVLTKLSAKFQLIVVAHSPLLLLEPDFNHIELVPNYRGQVWDTMQGFKRPPLVEVGS